MMIDIETNLRMELIDESHSEQLFRLVDKDRTYLKEWLPWVDSTISIENMIDFIKSSRNRYSDNNGFDCSIIKDASVIGIIGLNKIDYTNKTTSIGYWLGGSFQGHGYMTKSCQALIDYCFDVLNLNRIEIKCALQNLKSQAIPKRLDFKNEGLIRQAEFINGRYLDHYLFSKLKSEKKPATK